MALRAMLLHEVGEAHTELAKVAVDVRLVRDEQTRVRVHLRPAAEKGFAEGAMELPTDLHGRYRLLSRARLPGGGFAEVQGVLAVVPRPKPVVSPGRLATPLARWSLFPAHAAPSAVRPSALDLRAVGGLCVPEQRCNLLAWVGTPAAAVRLRSELGAAPVPGRTASTGATTGLVPLAVTVHGPEAEVTLIASRPVEGGGSTTAPSAVPSDAGTAGATAPAEVGHRRVRLPVALGSPAVRLSTSTVEAPPARPRLQVDGAEKGSAVFIDAFRDGLWERAGSVPAATIDRGAAFDLPFAPLEPGLWRIEVRTDPFSTDASSLRWLLVTRPGETAAAALRRTAQSLLDALGPGDFRDPFAEDLAKGRDPAPDAPVGTRAAFLFAPQEGDLMPLPPPLSSAVQASAGLGHRRRSLYWLAFAAVLLGVVLVAAIMLRRGLGAAAEARALMAEAGDPEAQSRRRRLRMTLSVVAMVLVVAFTFVAGAIAVIARGGF